MNQYNLPFYILLHIVIYTFILTSCGERQAPSNPVNPVETQTNEMNTDLDRSMGLSEPASGPLRNMRYCEVILVFLNDGQVHAEVWGTQSLNDCPQAQWAALNSEQIKSEYGAVLVKMNGPRYFIVDSSSGFTPPADTIRIYGELETMLLATIDLDVGFANRPPLSPITVIRSNAWHINAGQQIYELIAPDGQIYVMQAYSNTIDSTLDESALVNLGDRLSLPENWTYSTRILEEDLTIPSDGEAIVIQDELENTYQLYIP